MAHRRLPPLFVLAALLAIGVAWLVSSSRSPQAAASGDETLAPPASREEIESLRRSLEEQAGAILALTEELALLREEIADLRIPASSAPIAHREDDTAPTTPSPATGTDATTPAAPAAADRPSFDAQGLLAAGHLPREVERLRERWEQLALDRLELNDRALREGWLMEPRLRDEHAALEAAFREDIGEEGYDAFLYATGQPNRVLVREVIARSPASRAGVQAGDVIVSYDGTRTFLPRDLQLATGQGKRGELVRVEVVRDGRPLTLRVQRGPLGIILGGSAEPPRSPS